MFCYFSATFAPFLLGQTVALAKINSVSQIRAPTGRVSRGSMRFSVTSFSKLAYKKIPHKFKTCGVFKSFKNIV